MNFRRPLLLFFLPLYCMLANAQSLPKTLLWRISGKDSHQTSYLYGTLHLTDARLFNLGDSLYDAIRRSDGLAIELDPNVLATLAMEEVQKQISDEKNIRKILSEKEYKDYGPALAKKLGKPLSTITSQDILHEKNKWIRQSPGKSKMQSFLDIYLFDIARRQRKWTGGVEDMVDQQGLINDVVDKSDIFNVAADDNSGRDQSLQRMIEIYLQQDLNAIDSVFGDFSDKDRILIRRNYKMAQRMDSLSGQRSMVFAVGAAHLPGKEGLISLLRARGFQVEPVFSSRKIKSTDYPLPDLPETWETVTDDPGLYKVEMPGNPSDLVFFGMLKARAFIDFFSNTGYITMSVHSSFGPAKTDSLFDGMAARIFGKGKSTWSSVTLDGARGRLYSGVGTDGYKKGFLFEKKGIFYLAMATATEESDKIKKDIDHFLHSFHILESRPVNDKALSLTRFTDSALAFTMLVPIQPTPIAQRNPGGISHIYLGSDLQEGTYYFFGANSVNPGRYIENDSTFFQGLKKEVTKKLKQVDYDTSWIDNERLIVEYRGPMKDAEMTMCVRYIDRGDRWYSLLAMYPLTGPTPKVKAFFSSFSELDYPAHTWRKTLSTDSAFTAWTPQPFSDRQKDSSGTETYISYDSSRSTSYVVVAYKLSPYYWSLSDSAFWEDRIKAHVLHYRDSLTEKKAVHNGDAKGWEWIKRERSSHLFYRERLLLRDDRLYALIVNTAKDQIHTADNDRFFEDFRFSEPAAGNPYLHSKADPLLNDIFSTDSATAEKAYASLSEAKFEKENLPQLYHSLLRVSPLDRESGSGYKKVNHALLQAIKNLKDTGALRFVLEQYPSVPDSLAYIRNGLLTLVAERDSTHFASLVDLVRKDPPAEPIDYTVIATLADTPALTARFFPRLLPLLKDSLQRRGMLRLAARLLDSNCLDIRELAPYRGDLQTYGESRAAQNALSAENYLYTDKYLVSLLGRFHDASTNGLLKKFMTAKEGALKLKAIGALLENHQPVSAAATLSLAASNDHRLGLLQTLLDAGRMDLFPAAWRTQKAMGMAEVYSAATEDDDGEEAEEKPVITFIRETIAGTGSARQRFLFYKLRRGKEVHLACAGPYNLNPAKLSTRDISAYIDSEEPYSETKLPAQMDDLLRNFRPATP